MLIILIELSTISTAIRIAFFLLFTFFITRTNWCIVSIKGNMFVLWKRKREMNHRRVGVLFKVNLKWKFQVAIEIPRIGLFGWLKSNKPKINRQTSVIAFICIPNQIHLLINNANIKHKCNGKRNDCQMRWGIRDVRLKRLSQHVAGVFFGLFFFFCVHSKCSFVEGRQSHFECDAVLGEEKKPKKIQPIFCGG